MVLIPTASEIFNLDVPYAEEHWRFDLLDQTLATLQPLHPLQDSDVSITCDGTAQITRSLSGLALNEEETELVDPIKHRLRVTYVLPEASDQTDWPMGVFMFTETPKTHTTRGRRLSASMHDQSQILDNGRRLLTSIAPGVDIVPSVKQYALESGIPDMRILLDAAPGKAPSEATTWPPGTARLKFMRDMLGMVPEYLYFDNAGSLRGRLLPEDITTEAPDHVYADEGSGHRRVVGDHYSSSDDSYKCPNLYVVTSTDANQNEIQGEFRLPATHPRSVENLGYEAVRVIGEQGVPDQTSANGRALWHYLHDDRAFEYVEFDGPIDPRHDTHDIVRFDNESVVDNYHEVRWDVTCKAGAVMRHRIARIYLDV